MSPATMTPAPSPNHRSLRLTAPLHGEEPDKLVSDHDRWDAVRRRDPAAVGAFVYGVRTTGVYCRPSCGARLPRRENVSFHATCADAEQAGLRPCKRCRPNEIRPAGRSRVAQGDVGIAQGDVGRRVAALDWTGIAAELDAHGCATTGALLTSAECAALAGSYSSGDLFRSRIVMARHGFGRGEYKYFAYPLPEPIAALRAALYPALAAIANRWNEAMGIAARYPDDHAAFLARCHDSGQTKPTPLLLCYGAGDYNCLHQDIYGEHVSRCRSRSCSHGRMPTSAAATSCSPSSDRACSRARKSFRSRRAKA